MWDDGGMVKTVLKKTLQDTFDINAIYASYLAYSVSTSKTPIEDTRKINH
jgi:hypothetical protein